MDDLHGSKSNHITFSDHSHTHRHTHTHTHTHTHIPATATLWGYSLYVRCGSHNTYNQSLWILFYWPPQWNKDTHKVKSYMHLCKVPPQCSPVLTRTQKKRTTHKINVKSSGGIFNVYLNTPRDLHVFLYVLHPLSTVGVPPQWRLPPQCQIVHVFTPTM